MINIRGMDQTYKSEEVPSNYFVCLIDPSRHKGQRHKFLDSRSSHPQEEGNRSFGLNITLMEEWPHLVEKGCLKQMFARNILVQNMKRTIQTINLGRGFEAGPFQDNRVVHSQQATRCRSEGSQKKLVWHTQVWPQHPFLPWVTIISTSKFE